MWAEVVTWAGDVVVREKGKRGNLYFVNGKKLEAFGADVPQEVQGILRLGPLNWQRQHAAPFLLSESAGEVGRRLNEIVDLDIVDRALSIAQSDVRDVKRDIDAEKDRLAIIDHQVTALAGVEDLEPLVRKMETLNREIGQDEEQLERLLKTANAARELQTAVRTNLPEENLVAGRITRMRALLADVGRARTQLDGLNVLLDTIHEQQNTEARLAGCVVAAERELKREMGGICPLCKQRIVHEH